MSFRSSAGGGKEKSKERGEMGGGCPKKTSSTVAHVMATFNWGSKGQVVCVRDEAKQVFLLFFFFNSIWSLVELVTTSSSSSSSSSASMEISQALERDSVCSMGENKGGRCIDGEMAAYCLCLSARWGMGQSKANSLSTSRKFISRNGQVGRGVCSGTSTWV